MKYKSLSNSSFCALKYNIALQGFYFVSNGFLVCYSITILFAYKVLSLAMFKGFKAMLLSCVQVRQNKDVSRCNSVGGVIHKVVKGLLMV